MPKNSFLQAIFPSPKYSLAPIEQNNKGSVKIGQVVPVYARLVNTGESCELSESHLVRFMPTKAPTMEGYKVTFDAFAVPLSALGYASRHERDIMDFFNVKENGGEVANPFLSPMRGLNRIARVNGEAMPMNGSYSAVAPWFRPGLLGDYMNWPSMKAFRDKVRKWINTQTPLFDGDVTPWLWSGVSSSAATDFAARALLNHPDRLSVNALFTGLNVFTPFIVDDTVVTSDWLESSQSSVAFGVYQDAIGSANGDYSSLTRSLLGYILENYPAVASYYRYPSSFDDGSFNAYRETLALVAASDFTFTFDYLSVLYRLYGIDSQSIYNEWFENEVMAKLLFNPSIVNFNQDSLMELNFLPNIYDETVEPVDLSYFGAYWKIISDWYINTNIDGNPDDFFLSKFDIFKNDYQTRSVELMPFNRRWANDIFTSAVPQAEVTNVRIPVNGTIPDLREANAFQRLVDIFRNTGNRLRDVIYGLIGIRPSALASEMSQPIGTLSSWLGVSSVLQTSETTASSPQAAYSGIAADSVDRRHFFKYINNDEPTPVIVMVLMSVTQHSSYMQGFPRKFFRGSIYDFAIPQLANIGEQEIKNKELFFDWTGSSREAYDIEGIFGFNRRYYDWFYDAGNEVHGELRDTLDYWHGARIFDSVPLLNSEFIEINADKDHLQRGFANVSESAPSIVYNVRFDGAAVVALPRYIQYNL